MPTDFSFYVYCDFLFVASARSVVYIYFKIETAGAECTFPKAHVTFNQRVNPLAHAATSAVYPVRDAKGCWILFLMTGGSQTYVSSECQRNVRKKPICKQTH